jgi:hypothetical protein
MHSGWIVIHTYSDLNFFFITGYVHNHQMPNCTIIFISNRICPKGFSKVDIQLLGFRKMLDMYFI